jgi:hypothetical protein
MVHAQWTMFDVVYYYACPWHVGDMLHVLAGRRVDGNLPLDVWATWR